MRRRQGRIAWCLVVLLLLPLAAMAEAPALPVPGGSAALDYDAYLAQHSYEGVAADISLYAPDAPVSLGEGESFTFSFELPEAAFGYPVITYQMTGDNILDNAYTLMLDGAYPYAECEALTLDSWWTQPSAFSLDRFGNEVVSMPEKSYQVFSQRLTGKARLYAEGMGLYVSAGEHTMTIACREGAFLLHDVTLAPATPVPPGALEGPAGPQPEALITLQAEQVPLRSNPNIRPASEFDTQLTPYSNDKKVINYIEDVSYRYAGDTLTYTLTVETPGWYGVALRMRQSELGNFPVFRTVTVDGQVPSIAFDTVAFPYSLSFTNAVIHDDEGGVAWMYLDAGSHSLSLHTTLDPVRSAIRELTALSDEMAALALEITKITGGNTDFFRDFNLADFDFHIAEDLEGWIGGLTAVREALAEMAGSGRVGALSNLDVALELLAQLSEKPEDLPKRMLMFTKGESSARSFLVKMIEELNRSPMGLDCIYLFTDEALLPDGPGALAKAGAFVGRLGASFGEQSYMADGDGSREGRLQVWVNRPRQYLEILQRMADTNFTAETGIPVDFSIMPDESKLILANASGTAPDVALGVSSGRVYDLAVRGALMDLRRFDTFAEVGGWFPAGLLIPGISDDGLYALPETFNFYVLFYRKDILESINLPVPDSYEDVLAMLPTLHRYGLNYNNFVANAIGYKGFALTTPFIFQAGGLLFEDGNTRTLIDQPAAVEGLRLLTDSFIVYDMEFEINSFFQSFRDGTLPLGTANYAMYNLLMNAAPELADRWGIALYPGITDENGVVQRWTSGAEQSCFLFESTEMSEEAWAFLSWWMSEETQVEFAFTLQSTLGNEYLWNSANTEAFLRSPWPNEHKQVIAEQMQWIYEAPRLPGSYMVERELSNVVNGVALEGQNLRAALDEAVKRIDREVARKLEEFGRMENGELTVPFVVPTVETVRGWLDAQ